MSDARLSVRVDENIKKKAEDVFQGLGLTLSSGINLYLFQVAMQRGIPFPLVQLPKEKNLGVSTGNRTEEQRAQAAIKSIIDDKSEHNVPVALYDSKLKKPYIEYPDGRRVYEID